MQPNHCGSSKETENTPMTAKMPGNKDGNKKLWGAIHGHLGPVSYNMAVILGWPFINVEPEICGGNLKSCGENLNSCGKISTHISDLW